MHWKSFCVRRSLNYWYSIALRKRTFIRWCQQERRFRRCCLKKNSEIFEGENMHAFHIHYRNTQGTLMRILTAVSRRGLEIPYVLASASGHGHRADLLLDVNAKQIGQLCRDWHAIVDVTDVRVGAP